MFDSQQPDFFLRCLTLTGLPERMLEIHVNIIHPRPYTTRGCLVLLRHPPLLLNNSLFYATNYNQKLFKTTVDNFFRLTICFYSTTKLKVNCLLSFARVNVPTYVLPSYIPLYVPVFLPSTNSLSVN